MVDLNKTLIILRESFQRNIGIEVLFDGKTLELIPHKLTKEPNGEVILFASLDEFSEPQKFQVKDIQGVKLDVSTGVPSGLAWNDDYINSRSFLLNGKQETVVSKLDFSDEPNLIDTSSRSSSKKAKNITVTAKKKRNKKDESNVTVVSSSTESKKGIAHNPKVFWIIISIIMVIIVLFVVKPFEKNIFVPPEEEQQMNEYEEWVATGEDDKSAWKKKQDIPIDASPSEGGYTQFDKIGWRFPYSTETPNGWYRGFELQSELGEKIDVDSLLEELKDKDIYSSLINDTPVDTEDEYAMDASTYYSVFYSPERKCTIWHNHLNPIMLSKERIKELGFEKDDVGLSRYYAEDIISHLSDDSEVVNNEEITGVYISDSRYKMGALNYSFEDINLTVRAFSERGTVLYVYNDCGMSPEDLEQKDKFNIEVWGYPSVHSNNNPEQPEVALRR